MIKCNDCVPVPCCDFCGYYNFNGDSGGAYLDNGWCNKFNKQLDPEDGMDCNEFVCASSKEGKSLRRLFPNNGRK